MLEDPEDLAIIEGLLGLATAFRREVIAEGVESLAHGQVPLQLGCELAQGYAIAAPMPASEFPLWLDGWRPPPRWTELTPVSRDNLPALFAAIEHRAWRARIEGYLRGQHATPPALDYRHSQFERWLKTRGPERLGDPLCIPRIETLYEKARAVAGEILDRQSKSQNCEALARLDEFTATSDKLLQELSRLTVPARLSAAENFPGHYHRHA
jgi:hypothetical protein